VTKPPFELPEIVYWFRLPDNEELLMSLTLATLRCFMVVVRAIQRDRNAGRISLHQIADRAKISRKSAQRAIVKLVEQGLLNCDKHPGVTPVYHLPFSWIEKENRRSPVGDRSKAWKVTKGDRHPSPTGDLNRSPTGDTHLELSESSERLSAFASRSEQHRRSSSGTDDDAVRSAIEQVRAALSERAVVSCAFGDSDKAVVREMLAGGATVENIQHAILEGCARKLKMGSVVAGADLVWKGGVSPINSMAYFKPVLDEVRDTEVSQGYTDHLKDFLKRFEPRWLASRRGPGRSGTEVGRTRSAAGGGVS
jgi:hypothetical protein